MSEFGVNYIHAREKGRGSFSPGSRTLCYRCNEKGDRFVYVGGSRKFACSKHFREWLDASKKSRRIWEE